MTQLSQGLGLDLANPLAGDVKLFSDLLQGSGMAVVQAEAQAQYLFLPGR